MMLRKKQVITMVGSIAVMSFLISTTLNTNFMAIGSDNDGTDGYSHRVPFRMHACKIVDISWEHDRVYGLTEMDDFLAASEMFTITFNKPMQKDTINHKTLSLILVTYVFETEPTHIEEVIEKQEMPIEFIDSEDDEVIFSPHTEEADAVLQSLEFVEINPPEENWGLRLIIQLKGDFIFDTEGKCLDGNHLKGNLPTGDGLEGGLFESWFGLETEY